MIYYFLGEVAEWFKAPARPSTKAEGSPNGMALVSKTSGSNPLQVRVLYPPLWCRVKKTGVQIIYNKSMVLILFFLAFLLGPILYFNGKKSQSRGWKMLGIIAWLVGWAYLGYVLYYLSGFA